MVLLAAASFVNGSNIVEGALTAACFSDSLGRPWCPHKHPRDRHGRFIETFAEVRAFLKKGKGRKSDFTGKVVAMDPDGTAVVEITGGRGQYANLRKRLVRVPTANLEGVEYKARIGAQPPRALTRNERAEIDTFVDRIRSRKKFTPSSDPVEQLRDLERLAEAAEDADDTDARDAFLEAKNKVRNQGSTDEKNEQARALLPDKAEPGEPKARIGEDDSAGRDRDPVPTPSADTGPDDAAGDSGAGGDADRVQGPVETGSRSERRLRAEVADLSEQREKEEAALADLENKSKDINAVSKSQAKAAQNRIDRQRKKVDAVQDRIDQRTFDLAQMSQDFDDDNPTLSDEQRQRLDAAVDELRDLKPTPQNRDRRRKLSEDLRAFNDVIEDAQLVKDPRIAAMQERRRVEARKRLAVEVDAARDNANMMRNQQAPASDLHRARTKLDRLKNLLERLDNGDIVDPINDPDAFDFVPRKLIPAGIEKPRPPAPTPPPRQPAAPTSKPTPTPTPPTPEPAEPTPSKPAPPATKGKAGIDRRRNRAKTIAEERVVAAQEAIDNGRASQDTYRDRERYQEFLDRLEADADLEPLDDPVGRELLEDQQGVPKPKGRLPGPVPEAGRTPAQRAARQQRRGRVEPLKVSGAFSILGRGLVTDMINGLQLLMGRPRERRVDTYENFVDWMDERYGLLPQQRDARQARDDSRAEKARLDRSRAQDEIDARAEREQQRQPAPEPEAEAEPKAVPEPSGDVLLGDVPAAETGNIVMLNRDGEGNVTVQASVLPPEPPADASGDTKLSKKILSASPATPMGRLVRLFSDRYASEYREKGYEARLWVAVESQV